MQKKVENVSIVGFVLWKVYAVKRILRWASF